MKQGETLRAPLSPSLVLFHHVVILHAVHCLDVSHIFSQKCSAAWQGAPGQRLTVAIMLPDRQDADDWLNFMLSQKNL